MSSKVDSAPLTALAALPPEGGYGWLVLAAYSFNNILVLQLLVVFGLIFKDVFRELGIQGTDAAVILNTNNAFSLMLGLFIGPILRNFGARKTAAVGVLLVFGGMALTSTANSFIEFLIFYGFIMSAGLGLAHPSFSYTFNSYFKARRSMATGIAMTCTGFAAIFMPQLVSLLLREFGPRGCCLLFAAMSLHSLIGAILLHPVQWHPHRPSEPAPAGLGGEARQGKARRESTVSVWEASSVDLGRSVLALGGSVHDAVLKCQPEAPNDNPLERKSWGGGRSGGWGRATAKFFDLGLLRDPSFVNVVLGVSFAFFAEINFAVFLPFTCAERGYSTEEIATFLSVLAAADTACRFLAPFLHRLVGASSRAMYFAAIVGVVLSRIALLFVTNALGMVLVSALLGATKGFRVVFYVMVIPDAVPIERLPSAQGLQSLVNGVIFVSLGPLVGWLRDYFGTYDVVVVACSIMSCMTLVMWTVEFFWKTFAGRAYAGVPPGEEAAQAMRAELG